MDWALGVDVETGRQLQSSNLGGKRQCRWVDCIYQCSGCWLVHDPWNEQGFPMPRGSSLTVGQSRKKL